MKVKRDRFLNCRSLADLMTEPKPLEGADQGWERLTTSSKSRISSSRSKAGPATTYRSTKASSSTHKMEQRFGATSWKKAKPSARYSWSWLNSGGARRMRASLETKMIVSLGYSLATRAG